MSIEVLGLSGVLAGFAAAAAEFEAAEAAGREDAADAIRDAWVANIESEGLVVSGRYRDSVHVERDGERVLVRSDVPYGPILERGDSRQAAHYVAERAFDEHAEEAIERVGDALRKVIR